MENVGQGGRKGIELAGNYVIAEVCCVCMHAVVMVNCGRKKPEATISRLRLMVVAFFLIAQLNTYDFLFAFFSSWLCFLLLSNNVVFYENCNTFSLIIN